MKAYTVLQQMIINGTHYNPGDAITCPDWQAKALRNSGMVGNEAEVVPPAVPEVFETAEAKQPVEVADAFAPRRGRPRR